MVQIIGAVIGSPTNLSHIAYNPRKLAAVPTYNGQSVLLFPYGEIDGYKEHWDDTHGETTRYYRIPWSVLFEAKEWFLGYSQNVLSPGMVTVGVLSRTVPAQDPRYPWLYCVDFALERGEGAVVLDPANLLYSFDPVTGAQVPDVQLPPRTVPALAYVGNDQNSTRTFSDGVAVVKVTFRDLPYEVKDDVEVAAHPAGEQGRYVERDIQPSVEALPLSKLMNQLRFTEGPYGPPSTSPIPEAGVKLLSTHSAKYLWHAVPDFDKNVLDRMLGTTNQNPLYAGPDRAPFPPGTALLMQPETKRRRSPVGSVVTDVYLRWLVRTGTLPSQGWNAYPAVDGKFYMTAFAVGGGTVYQSADHNLLFALGPPLNWQTA